MRRQARATNPCYSDHRPPPSSTSPLTRWLRPDAAKKKEALPFEGAIPADTGSWLLMQDQEGRMYW